MKSIRSAFYIVFLLIVSFPTFSADLEKGIAAARSGDFETALSIWRPLAESGNASAQYFIGMLYYNGHGVRKDFRAAAGYFRKAADQQHSGAQYRMGNLSRRGLGIPKSNKQAFDWYVKAAKAGHSVAQNNLGLMYKNGHGVPQDVKVAYEWITRSAEAGYKSAQYNLGNAYRTGVGVPKSTSKAIKYYELAAQQGHRKALKNLKLLKAESRGEKAPSTPKLPKSGPVVTYKGRKLIGSTYPKANNQAFFKTVKMAIDMTEILPTGFRKRSVNLIKEIFYDPPSPMRKAKGAELEATGVYHFTNRSKAPGPVVIYRDIKWSSAGDVATSLLLNSLHANAHVELETIVKEMERLSGQGQSNQSKFTELKHRRDQIRATVLRGSYLDSTCNPKTISGLVRGLWGRNKAAVDRFLNIVEPRNCWKALKA